MPSICQHVRTRDPIEGMDEVQELSAEYTVTSRDLSRFLKVALNRHKVRGSANKAQNVGSLLCKVEGGVGHRADVFDGRQAAIRHWILFASQIESSCCYQDFGNLQRQCKWRRKLK